MAETEKTLDFAPNHAHVIELNITPGKKEKTWAWAQRGILECTPESDETTSEDAYYHLLGTTETSVDSIKVSIAMSGHRMYGDPVQDFVQSLALLTGDDRKTDYRWTMPDGTVLEGECTLAELVPGSGMGEANAKGEFAYRINLNTFERSGGGMSAMPAAVTAEAVTMAAGATAEVGAKVAPEGANQRCHYAVEDTSIATVDSSGKVTGVAEGETTMTIKAAAKPSVVAQCKVTVTGAARSLKA